MLEIAGDLTTEGGEGQSLVKGVQVNLKAIALSVKPGGVVGSIVIGGQVRTGGDDVITIEIDGQVDQLQVAGGVAAEGHNSDAIHLRGDSLDLGALTVTAAQGKTVVTMN